MKTRRKTRLPRLALLAYSPKELQRFVEAAEKVASAAGTLATVAARLEFVAHEVNNVLLALEARKPRGKKQPANGEPAGPAEEGRAGG